MKTFEKTTFWVLKHAEKRFYKVYFYEDSQLSSYTRGSSLLFEMS